MPVLNLGVASYGTVREVIRIRMHPRFQDANCIVYQYSWNDFDETASFSPWVPYLLPRRKDRSLAGRLWQAKNNLQDVMLQTFDFLVNHPLRDCCEYLRMA